MNGIAHLTKTGASALLVFLCIGLMVEPDEALAQDPQDTTAVADSLVAPAGFSVPVLAVLGFGYGMRNDGCILCESPEEDNSFSAYLGIVRPLWHGIGVGVDVSVWRKGRPGTPGALDPEGVPEPKSLSNILGNLSVSFSYDYWHLFARAGAGISLGRQDLEMENQEGNIITHTAAGWGPGYSVGGGITVPVASMLSLAFYANYNAGFYDLVSPQGLTERDANHRYLELGIGVAMR